MGRKVWIQPKDGWVYTQKQEASPSPIRTRREIVPGEYGAVDVRETDEGGMVQIFIKSTNPTLMSWYTADELREAAHILNQIAEVLEENANDVG